MATTSSDIERLLAAPDARVDLGMGAQLIEVTMRLPRHRGAAGGEEGRQEEKGDMRNA